MNHFSYPLTIVQVNIFEEPQNIFSQPKSQIPNYRASPLSIFNYRVPPPRGFMVLILKLRNFYCPTFHFHCQCSGVKILVFHTRSRVVSAKGRVHSKTRCSMKKKALTKTTPERKNRTGPVGKTYKYVGRFIDQSCVCQQLEDGCKVRKKKSLAHYEDETVIGLASILHSTYLHHKITIQ